MVQHSLKNALHHVNSAALLQQCYCNCKSHNISMALGEVPPHGHITYYITFTKIREFRDPARILMLLFSN